MKTKTIGFNGESFDKTSLEDFFGKWIVVKEGDVFYSGKIKEINTNDIGLSPYQRIKYTENGPTQIIEEKGLPYVIKRNQIKTFRETTEEETSNFCKFNNGKIFSEEIKKPKHESLREIYGSQILGL